MNTELHVEPSVGEFALVHEFINSTDDDFVVPETLAPVPEISHVEVSSSDSSSEESSSSVPDFQAASRRNRKLFQQIANLSNEAVVYIHGMSDIVHYRTSVDSNKLKCGRRVNATLVRMRPPFEEAKFQFKLLCKQCFN